MVRDTEVLASGDPGEDRPESEEQACGLDAEQGANLTVKFFYQSGPNFNSLMLYAPSSHKTRLCA